MLVFFNDSTGANRKWSSWHSQLEAMTILNFKTMICVFVYLYIIIIMIKILSSSLLLLSLLQYLCYICIISVKISVHMHVNTLYGLHMWGYIIAYTVLVKIYVYIKKQVSTKICYSRGSSPPNPREKQGLPVKWNKYFGSWPSLKYPTLYSHLPSFSIILK